MSEALYQDDQVYAGRFIGPYDGGRDRVRVNIGILDRRDHATLTRRQARRLAYAILRGVPAK